VKSGNTTVYGNATNQDLGRAKADGEKFIAPYCKQASSRRD